MIDCLKNRIILSTLIFSILPGRDLQLLSQVKFIKIVVNPKVSRCLRVAALASNKKPQLWFCSTSRFSFAVLCLKTQTHQLYRQLYNYT